MEGDEKPGLIAYDGSGPGKAAIEEAGAQLRTPRKAVVVAAYEPLGAIPFWGVPASTVPTELLDEVTDAASKTADEGGELARAAGFDASSQAVVGVRTWQTILDAA